MSEKHTVWRKAFWILLAAHLAIWTLIPLLSFRNISLDTAEATAWGHEWQWGYFKHPPLSGWLAEIGRIASGRQATWGLYFIARIVIAIAMYAAWRLALRLVSQSMAFVAVLALEASFLYTIVSLEFNVNTTLLPFVVLSAWFLFEGIKTGKWKWWIGFGIACGFGMLSKYTMVLEIAKHGNIRNRRASMPNLAAPSAPLCGGRDRSGRVVAQSYLADRARISITALCQQPDG